MHFETILQQNLLGLQQNPLLRRELGGFVTTAESLAQRTGGPSIPVTELFARSQAAGARVPSLLQETFAGGRDFRLCRNEFSPDPGGRGWESGISAQTRCFARFHLGSQNEPEPTGFTPTRQIAGGSFGAAIRVIVPAILALGTTLVAGGLAGGAIGRVTQTRPSTLIPVNAPQPEPQPARTGQVFDFIRRNGIFLALGLGLFAFFRR